MNGKLIVFEGANEVGKSTLAALLFTELKSRQIDCDLVAFPGNQLGTLGRHVYEIHHGPQRFAIDRIDATSVQMLHVAAHIDAIESIIKPALSTGRTIILDRFWWSAWVYGTINSANPASLNLMVEVEQNHWENYLPAIVFLVKRSLPLTPLYDVEHWRRIASVYDELATREHSKYRIDVVHNDGTVDIAHTHVLQVIDSVFEEK